MIGWFDGTSGASGDMFLGALVGAGVPIEVLQASIDSLDLGITLRQESVVRGGLGATRVHVDVPETRTVRHLAEVEALLNLLAPDVRHIASAVFRRLGAAEAAVHQVPIEEVHFHEVGALDSIADIVGACAGIVHLRAEGLTALHCSTLSLGNGQSRGAHGPVPIPAPAVLQLVAASADGAPSLPVQAGPAPFEATTPTGAALMAELIDHWCPMPPMAVERIGVGAGGKDSTEVANALRLVLGEPIGALPGDAQARREAAVHLTSGASIEPAIQLDANIDDLDPRIWPTAIDAVLTAGADDAWVTPIIMKKGRPAHTFSALCAPAAADAVRQAIFCETSTIGIREHPIDKHALVRAMEVVEVDGCPIRVKVASYAGAAINRSIEWDDVAAAAAKLGRSAKDVLAEATAKASESSESAGHPTAPNPPGSP